MQGSARGATRAWITCGLVAFLAASQPPAVLAQMDMSGGTVVTGTINQTAPADLPPPQKITGIGNSHMRINARPEAQMWFDQGLNLIHDFWDYESARAFEQSVRADPQCAICYWGLYLAESFYHGLAQGYAAPALARAVSLKGRASRRERLYIEASEEAQNSGKPGPLFGRETQLWRKLAKDYPKDIQARLFLAQRVGQKEKLAILEGILKEDPGNSAANHYYIHALEAGPHPEQALHSAELLASLAPASGHMVHMPGHIFSRTGDYARAEQAFAASMLVDERYMETQHVQPDNDWNYVHNLMYAIANLMEEGKLNQATALSAKLTTARGELESTLYTYSTRDSISRLDPRLPVALRTADWPRVQELLSGRLGLPIPLAPLVAAGAPESGAPPAELPHLEFLARQLAILAEGMQAAESHDPARAEASSAQFDAGLWRMSQQSKHAPDREPADPPRLQVRPDAQLEPLLSILSIMSLELRGSLLVLQGKPTDSHALFVKAADAEKALGYHEPPSYIRPVGEAEAAAMMAASHWADARAAYEQALRERPRSGFALYGIALTSEKAGDSAAAAKEYADFLLAWKDADPSLTQVVHARSYVGAR